ncbi:MAG TPA: amidohydrolase [Bacteroidia bacterium]|nr:amidohydrolase [Bacteroidia bacterium]HRS58463.1 amidohydrolase [Bacteroidia bacterium]HRU68579.1 amidohydrolase [Bacteroidia bacterium]
MIIRLQPLTELRHKLHQQAELSGKERKTAEIILSFMKKHRADEVITHIAGNGLAFIYKGKTRGPKIMVRAEMDALPIAEKNENIYRSANENVAHQCGHDGHMAILCGLGRYLAENRPDYGRVILLFQPSEEDGRGALEVLNDLAFPPLTPDYVISFHNLPGFPSKSIICKEGLFSIASAGLKIHCKGKSAHAASDKEGFNPVHIASYIINEFEELNNKEITKDFSRITVTHIHGGVPGFGILPEDAILYVVVRAFRTDDFEMLKKTMEKIIDELYERHGIEINYSWHDEFLPVVNDSECVQVIRNAATINGFEYIQLRKANLWSEDFSHFTSRFKGAMFCIGSGIHHPELHTPDYDFPDEIIEPGIKMLTSIIHQISKNGNQGTRS